MATFIFNILRMRKVKIDLLNLIPKNSNQLRPMEKSANYLICIIINIDKKT